MPFQPNANHACRFLFIALVTGLFVGSAWLPASAAGTIREGDLQVAFSSGWTNGQWGGYIPIRISISNDGPAHDLKFQLVPYNSSSEVPAVVRRLRIDEHATARLTLLVPVLSSRVAGQFTVFVDDQPQPLVRKDLALSGQHLDDSPGLAMLYVSDTAIESPPYRLGARAAVPGTEFASAYGRVSAYRPAFGIRAGQLMGNGSRMEVIPAESLPVTWLGFSALDVVAIELADLRRISPAQRQALFSWVATGGRLVVHQADHFARESSRFKKQLAQWHWDQSLGDWIPASPGRLHDVLLPPEPHEAEEMARGPFSFGRMGAAIGQMTRPGRGNPPGHSEHPEHPETRPSPRIKPDWLPNPDPFATARHGFGRIAVTAADLAGANAADWNWLLSDLGGLTIPWAVRYGLASGAGNREFINLPIPGVRGVPTIALFILITLFAIIIGPVNFFLFWRKGQLSRLLLTVPVLAVITSLLLFAYGALAHGFDTKGRIRSVTWVDSAANTATSITRMSLFAGFAPAGGLQFSRDTAVYPLLPLGSEFTGGKVDWTNGQSLTDGWLKTRTRTQFVTVSHRDERGRLQVSPADEGPTVTNGFEVPLAHLIVKGEDGRLYYGRDIAPGSAKRLVPMTNEHRGIMREMAIERIPEPPAGVDPDKLASVFGGTGRRRYRYRWHPQMGNSLLERHLDLIRGTASRGKPSEITRSQTRQSSNRMIAAVRNDTITPLALPHGFLAVATEAPGLDLGGLSVHERQSLHLLMGVW